MPWVIRQFSVLPRLRNSYTYGFETRVVALLPHSRPEICVLKGVEPKLHVFSAVFIDVGTSFGV